MVKGDVTKRLLMQKNALIGRDEFRKYFEEILRPTMYLNTSNKLGLYKT
jgi:hypothetical protein